MQIECTTTDADRIVVSYRAPAVDSDGVEPDGESDSGFDEDHLVHDRIQANPFAAYLRRVHGGDVAAGDEWTEFVNCGCGTTTDVVLRVEAVENGSTLGKDTDVELVPADDVGAA